MRVKSIYNLLKELVETMPQLPYSFQDNLSSGSKECIYILKDRYDIDISSLENSSSNIYILSFDKKEYLSKKLIDLIFEALESKKLNYDIFRFLSENNLYEFMDVFQNKLDVYLNEKQLFEKKLYNFSLDLTLNSTEYELVSLGIILLGFFENDFSKKIIRFLGLHSIFTAYSIQAYKKFKNYNELVYDFAKNTTSFGKIISIISFNPINEQQLIFILSDSIKDKYFSSIISYIILKKPEVQSFLLSECNLKKLSINSIAYIISHGLEYLDDYDIDNLNKFFEIYLKELSFNDDLMVLSSIIIIEKMLKEKSEYGLNESYVDGNKFKNKFLLLESIKIMINDYNWKTVIDNNIVNPLIYSPKVWVNILNRLNITPDFFTWRFF